jgi:hypothetical protein
MNVRDHRTSIYSERCLSHRTSLKALQALQITDSYQGSLKGL